MRKVALLLGINIQYEARRGDREADGAALEKRFSMFRDVGSNPTLSACPEQGREACPERS